VIFVFISLTCVAIGRGPIQLSWNYNYKDFGDYMQKDLLNNPDDVAHDETLAWKSAFWFWMSDKKQGNIHDKLQDPAGNFMWATYITNGVLECGTNPLMPYTETSRINRYTQFCNLLNVTVGDNLSCHLAQFNTPTSTPTPYWTSSVPTSSAPTTSPAPSSSAQPTTPTSSTSTPTTPVLTSQSPTPSPTTGAPGSEKCICNQGACTNGKCMNCNYISGDIKACYSGWSAEICKAQGSGFNWCG